MKGGEKNMIKKILIGLGILFVVIVIISMASGGSSTEPIKVGENSNTSQEQQKEYKVADIVKLGDREFVVNSVRRSGAFNYNTPDAGKEYVIVNVTIRNLGKDEVSYNPFDFKVQDANGAQENSTFATLDDSLSSGTLAPNGKVTGSMPFEVPTGTNAKLIFQPSFWSDQRVVVDLGNE